MLGGMTNHNWSNDLSDKQKSAMERIVTLLGEEITAAARAAGLPVSKINGTAPSDAVIVLDKAELHVVFERASSNSTNFFMRWFPDSSVRIDDVAAFARDELGMNETSGAKFPKNLLDATDDEMRRQAREAAKQLVVQFKDAAGKPRALAGFEAIQPQMDAFFSDHPVFEKNVFVAMRFADTPQNNEIWNAIKVTLDRYGMKAHRADAKSYPQDDDLWSNVCVYMMGCKFGICVFDQIDARDFNPNVQIEYGFMRASNKRVLLLKDQRQPTMPVDITGKIRREFDTYNISATVSARVAEWLERDLGLKAIV